MALLGTVMNTLAIVIGTLIGKVFTKIPEQTKKTVMQVIGMSVLLLGIQMGLKSEQILIVIFSLVIGGIIGEVWDLELKLNALGNWLERKIGSNSTGSIAKGFVTATLIYCIGAMGIIGALDSGIRGDHTVLYMKSLLDGFMSLLLTTTLGIGVIFSAVPVLLYQGSISLFATQINHWIPESLMNAMIIEMTAAGGIMILAIGLNILEIIHIRVANLLPSILIVVILVTGSHYWQNMVYLLKSLF